MRPGNGRAPVRNFLTDAGGQAAMVNANQHGDGNAGGTSPAIIAAGALALASTLAATALSVSLLLSRAARNAPPAWRVGGATVLATTAHRLVDRNRIQPIVDRAQIVLGVSRVSGCFLRSPTALGADQTWCPRIRPTPASWRGMTGYTFCRSPPWPQRPPWSALWCSRCRPPFGLRLASDRTALAQEAETRRKSQ